jgi:predicted ArsR family transcriptional regulator
MHPDSKASRVLRILADGPATTSEVAAETGWTVKIACAHLLNLVERGKVDRSPFHRKGQRSAWLWRLADDDELPPVIGERMRDGLDEIRHAEQDTEE